MFHRGLSRPNAECPRKIGLALHKPLDPLPDRAWRSDVPLVYDVVKKVFKAVAEAGFLTRALDASAHITYVVGVWMNNVRA
jgi:hypothetical protein